MSVFEDEPFAFKPPEHLSALGGFLDSALCEAFKFFIKAIRFLRNMSERRTNRFLVKLKPPLINLLVEDVER